MSADFIDQEMAKLTARLDAANEESDQHIHDGRIANPWPEVEDNLVECPDCEGGGGFLEACKRCDSSGKIHRDDVE